MKLNPSNKELYVGGDFQVIAGQIIPCLAKWDGTNWSSVAQINGPVEDMIVFQNKLYIQVDEIENPQSIYNYNKIYAWYNPLRTNTYTQTAHLVFADTKACAEKTKRA